MDAIYKQEKTTELFSTIIDLLRSKEPIEAREKFRQMSLTDRAQFICMDNDLSIHEAMFLNN